MSNYCDSVFLRSMPKISQATKSKLCGDSMLDRARKPHMSGDLRSRGEVLIILRIKSLISFLETVR